MIDDWMKSIPALAPGGVWACPVDGCNSVFSVPGPEVSPLADSLRVHGVTLSSLETVLGQHMAGHTAVDFLRTIRARDRRITELERTLDGWCH